MKKIIFLLIACVIVLSGCGSGKLNDVSQEMYDAAVYTIKATDLYLDGESTAYETYDKIDSLIIQDSEGYDRDALVNMSILNIKLSLLGVDAGASSISDIKEGRSELAEEINYKD